MKTISRMLTLLLVLALLAACNGVDAQSAIETGVAQTLQISELQTAAAGGGNNQTEVQDQSQEQSTDSGSDTGDAATETSTPTITSTPTPDVPTITLSQDTNCRTGPAVYYGYVTTVAAGVQMEVVGVPSISSVAADYVIVKNPNGSGNCWMWLRYADNKDFSSYGLQSYNTPPTPTPTLTPTPAFDWSGSWTIYVDDGAGGYNTYSMSVSVSGNSASSTFPYGGGDSVTLSGSLTNGLQNWAGSYTDTAAPGGTFQFKIKSGNSNQFIGSGVLGGTTYEWCGARSGASQPSPCLWP